MIDALVSLAFSIHNSKGVYAVLLGSGVSTSAGIPTGWGIVTDLIRKLAVAHGETCEPAPEAWFRSKFGEPPGYSRLLDLLGKTASERHSFLKGYIEPTVEEREQGRKVPTRAHRAIASLAASGHVKVILTLNFDRLMEAALEAAGVAPTVISTTDSVAGATPLAHSPCTLVKLHGDYLDTRIKNTPEELASYDAAIDRLLDRVLDEYGIIACGWSADWDTALRTAFERCPNRRYSTYWAARGEPGERAKQLIALRRAEILRIDGADGFFEGLAEKVAALEAFARPHPISKAIAVANAKKYLAEPRFRIQLHDLVGRQADQLTDGISPERLPAVVKPDKDPVWERMRKYEGLTETLAAVMAAGCYWAEGEQAELWPKVLGRVGNSVGASSGSFYEATRHLPLYPALILLYAGGLASTARGNYGLLRSLLTGAEIRVGQGEETTALNLLTPWCVLDDRIAKQLPGVERHHTAISDRLWEVLREPLQEYLPDEAEYDRCFDHFEYLRSLLTHHHRTQSGGGGTSCCPGRFSWRRHRHGQDIFGQIREEVGRMGADWPPLEAGWFDGDLGRLTAIKDVHDREVGSRSVWH